VLTIIVQDVMKDVYEDPDFPGLSIIHWCLKFVKHSNTGIPKGFVSRQCLSKNIMGSDVSDAVELAKKPVKNKTNEDWKYVITHGMHLAFQMNKLMDRLFSQMYFGLTNLSTSYRNDLFLFFTYGKIDSHVVCRSAGVAIYGSLT
jgi:hypothetical protein